MARVTLTKVTPVGPYPTLQPAANSLDLPFTAADTVNKEQFAADADNLILVWNTHATNAGTFTVSSVVDEKKRTGDINAYSVGAGEIAHFRTRKSGWMQTDGNIYIEASANTMKFCILKL